MNLSTVKGGIRYCHRKHAMITGVLYKNPKNGHVRCRLCDKINYKKYCDSGKRKLTRRIWARRRVWLKAAKVISAPYNEGLAGRLVIKPI